MSALKTEVLFFLNATKNKKNNMKKVLMAVCFFAVNMAVWAQEAKIAAGYKNRDDKPVMQIKFMFAASVISNWSIDIYRKSALDNTWEKINKVPLTKAPVLTKDQFSRSPLAADESFKSYQGFMNREPAKDVQEEENGLAFAGLMLVSDNQFATYAGCYYEDNTVENGKTYQYKLMEAGTQQKVLAISEAVTIKNNYLSSVAGIAAKQEGQQVLLNWHKMKTFYAYIVYRKNTPVSKAVSLTEYPILLGNLSGENIKNKMGDFKFIDSSLAPGTTVYYQVSGVDVLGNESPLSDAVKIEIKDAVPPPAVSHLIAKKDKATVQLNWEPVTGKDCIGYNIYRNSTSDTTFKKINTSLLATGTKQFLDPVLAEGAVYAYYVQSIDAAGNTTHSRMSKAFMPDQTPPAKPQALKGMPQPGSIRLVWNKNNEADLQGYYIYRATTRNPDYFNLLNREPLTQNSYIDTLPAIAKNEFVYYIQAVDKSYNKSEYSDMAVLHLPDTTAPHAPYLREVAYTSHAVHLRWQKPEADVIAYDIYKREGTAADRFNKLNRSPVKDLVFTDSAIDENKTFYYQVRAIDAAGNNSPPSVIHSIFIEYDTTALTVVENTKAVYNSRDSSVLINWTSRSKNVHGYVIYRRESGDDNFEAVSPVITTIRYLNKDIEPGKSYQYFVRTYFDTTPGFKNSAIFEVSTNP